MKKLFAFTFLLLTYGNLWAQAVSVEDPDNMAPDAEIKIIVDLTQTSNDWGIIEDAASGEDMYIWTWKPAEHPAGHPLANGIGSTAWKNSNEALKMTKEAEGIYSYTMTPTEFYGVTAKEVYDNDIHFLVKPKDGGGYGDPDHKTEDLLLEFELPAGPSLLLYTFPFSYGPDLDSVKLAEDDIFSIVYDLNEEPKPSMKDATELYVYIEVTGSDNNQYSIASSAKKVADFPFLMMDTEGDGVFVFSVFLSDLITELQLPDGVTPVTMSVQVVKPNLVNSDDLSDEELLVNFVICD